MAKPEDLTHFLTWWKGAWNNPSYDAPDCGDNYVWKNIYHDDPTYDPDEAMEMWHDGDPNSIVPVVGDRLWGWVTNQAGIPEFVPRTVDPGSWYGIGLRDEAVTTERYYAYFFKYDSQGYVTEVFDGMLCRYEEFGKASTLAYNSVPPECETPARNNTPLIVSTSNRYLDYIGVVVGSGVRKSPKTPPYMTTPPFNGNDKWYVLRTGLSVKINTSGTITQISSSSNCLNDIIESGNSVADNSNKYSAFNNSCGVPITSYTNVDISDNRVFHNNSAFDGKNLYYRTDQYRWIKIDSSGYIVDSTFYDCQQGRVLLCEITTEIPIDETSMINVGSFYNLSPPSLSLINMGFKAGISPPVNFPDDFQGLTHKVYILLDAQIETASQCRANLPYNAQTITVTINSSNNLFYGLNLCDDFDVTFTPLFGGTNFITMNDCNPSGDGEMRMSLNVASSPNVDRGVRVTFSNDNLSYSFIIWQLVIQM